MENWLYWAVIVCSVAVVAMLGVVVVLIVKMRKSFRLLSSEDVPFQAKFAFWASIVYTICPIDLLPDPIYLDDIGILLAGLHSLNKAAERVGINA
ncbi:YkvA family protein [Streptomyces sp. NPDC058417]|uniref:YkvA family protein n=1 Tax=unclassified Streptomyces TaxID=2593676 RepID=UPI00365CAE15